MKVEPKEFSGYLSIPFQIFGKGPKMNITCGNCSTSFSYRIPLVDDPGCPCPTCKAVNVLPLELK